MSSAGDDVQLYTHVTIVEIKKKTVANQLKKSFTFSNFIQSNLLNSCRAPT